MRYDGSPLGLESWGLWSTKLYPPGPVADLIVKQDLLDRLSEGLRFSLTLVSAPAGYGKSTLISSWLTGHGFPRVWISLERKDNEARDFLRYLVHGILSVAPNSLAHTARLLNAGELPPNRVLIDSLLRELAQLEILFVVVLDDFHLIENQEIYEVVDSLIDAAPQSLHLVIIGRWKPPLGLQDLCASQRLTEIHEKDLRFEKEDTERFLRWAPELGLSEKQAVRLHHLTEGWPAGLRMAVQALRGGTTVDDLVRAARNNPSPMHLYLESLLSGLQPTVRQGLEKISLLERFCAPLCTAMCGIEDDSRFEQLLERAGLLVISLDGHSEWYRFHHLLSAFLRSQLSKRVSPAELSELHRKASVWLAGAGWMEDALRHALKAEDTDLAIRLVTENGEELVNAEQWERLERWLSYLEISGVELDPRLLIWRAYCYDQRFRLGGVMTTLHRAEVALATSSEAPPPQLLGEIGTLRMQQAYLSGRGDEAVRRGCEALDWLPAQALGVRGHHAVLLAASLQMVGKLAEGRALLYKALAESAAKRDTYHSRALTGLCWVEWMAADFPALKEAALRLVDLGTKLGFRESSDFGRYFLGIYHYQRNELAEAEEHLSELTAEPYFTRAVIWIHGAFALALNHLARGKTRDALDLSERIVGHLLEIGNTEVLPVVRAFQAELDACCGRMIKAEQWASKDWDQPFFPMCMFYAPELTWAKIRILRGDPASLEQAGELLARFRADLERSHNRLFVIAARALEALLHQARGRLSEAESELEKALRSALPSGIVRCFVDLGPPLLELLRGLELDPEMRRFADRILEAADPSAKDGEEPFATPSSDLAGLDLLSRREHEVFRLLARRLTNQEIASELGISAATVKRHAANLYSKLGVSGRRAVVVLARNRGLPAG